MNTCNWVLFTERNKDFENRFDGTWRELQCGNPAIVQSLITQRCYCQEHKERFINDLVPFYDLVEAIPPFAV